MSADLDQVRRHLEFLGYAVSDEGEGRIGAKHAVRPNLVARDFRGGCLLTAYFRKGSTAERNRLGFLEAINGLNSPAAVARFYADDDGDLATEAFFNYPYDRGSFGQFMTLWDQDFDRMLSSSSEMAKFLS